jgi:fatty acid desaturase
MSDNPSYEEEAKRYFEKLDEAFDAFDTGPKRPMKTPLQPQFNLTIGPVSAITIVFVILKLTGHITWAWGWVLSPLWLGAALALAAIVLVFVAYLTVFLFSRLLEWISDRRTRKGRL